MTQKYVVEMTRKTKTIPKNICVKTSQKHLGQSDSKNIWFEPTQKAFMSKRLQKHFGQKDS